MKLRKSLFMCATLVVAVFAYRCSDDKLENVEPAEVQLTDLEKIKRLGLSTEGIQQEGEDYIVEGDIRITPEFLNEQGFSNLKQARGEKLVSCQNAKNIKVKIEYKKDGKPYKQAAAAIKKWNNLKGDILSFEIVTSNPDITIKPFNPNPVFYPSGKKISGKNMVIADFQMSYRLGEAGFPSRGKPFNTVKFNNEVVKSIKKKIAYYQKSLKEEARSENLKTINDIPIDKWTIKKDFPEIYEEFDMITYEVGVANLMHELGHCVGLWHTNWKKIDRLNPGEHIPGTAEFDEESVMNGRSGLKLKPAFSSNDKKAIKALYKNMEALCKTYGK